MADQDIRVRISVDGASSAGSTLNKAAADVRKVGDSAVYTKQQLQQLNFQLTDIFTGLATGQSPLTVLLQQGGQLKDTFGGVGGAARALATGVGGLVNPATLAAAAVAGLGVGFLKGDEQSAAFRRSLTLTGNAAGQTADTFDALSRRTADMSNVTIGTARELAAALVSSGQFGSTALDTITVAAAKLQDMTGQTSEDVVKDFASMSKGVAEWAAQHNQAWNFVTEAQLQQIRTLEDTGNAQAAMVAVGQALIEHLGDQRENLGLLETAWREMGIAASSVWDSLLDIGRADTLLDKLGEAQNRLNNIRRGALGTGLLSQWVSGSEDEALRAVENANRLVLRGFDQAKGKEAAAEQEKQKARLTALQERLNGANGQYSKDLREIIGLTKTLNLSDKQRDELLEAAAFKYGSKEKGKTAKQIAAEQEAAYRKMVDSTLGNRAPRLADIEASGYEDANRAAQQNMAAQAEQMRRRNQVIADLGVQLQDETRQLNISLIADDRERGLAQIEIERQTLQQRLDLLEQGGYDVSAAQAALNANILAKQEALNEQLKPAWEKMTDGWRDSMRTMRETYDEAMSGILSDAEDIFVNLGRGKFDAKALLGNLQETLLRGTFRQYFGNDVKNSASQFLGLFGLGSGGGSNGGSSADSWEADVAKLIGATDKQTGAADASARSLITVGKMADLFGDLMSTAASGVVQFIAGLAGNGNQYGWLAAIASIWGGSGGTGSGVTSGNQGLADYGLGGGRAYGGHVRAGMDYTVGENGIETLRMFHGGGGMVTPMGGNGAGARTGQTVNNYYITCQAGVSPAQMHAYGVELGKAIEGRVYESAARPGRPLNRAARSF